MCFLNVNMNLSIKDRSCKYISIVYYLNLHFYCVTCSAMLILIIIALIIKIEMLLEFQNEMNIEIIRFLLIHLRFVLDLTAIDL